MLLHFLHWELPRTLTKSFLAFSTQQTRTIEIAYLVRIVQIDVFAFADAVVMWTVVVMNKTYQYSIVI